MSDTPIFILIAELAAAVGASPVRDKLWQYRVNEHWTLAVNGCQDEQEFIALGSETRHKLDPYHAYVEFNGWPAGVFQPYGGSFAAGSAANETTFAAALKAATEKAKVSA